MLRSAWRYHERFATGAAFTCLRPNPTPSLIRFSTFLFPTTRPCTRKYGAGPRTKASMSTLSLSANVSRPGLVLHTRGGTFSHSLTFSPCTTEKMCSRMGNLVFTPSAHGVTLPNSILVRHHHWRMVRPLRWRIHGLQPRSPNVCLRTRAMKWHGGMSPAAPSLETVTTVHILYGAVFRGSIVASVHSSW